MTETEPEPIDLEVITAARALADDLLFPRALETDEADVVPIENLDALADGGFYGLFAPQAVGGLGANGATMAATLEAMAGGCLTTALVWVQHFGLLGNTVFGPDPLRERWGEDLVRGRLRGGIAFGGLLPGPPILTATPAEGGWVLDGHAPWVSGWGRIDLIHVAARGPDDTIVNVVIDAEEAPGVTADRQRLVAIDASATVHLTFEGLAVPEDRVLSVHAYDPGASLGSSLRLNGCLALGVAGRCLRLIGPSPLDAGLDAAAGSAGRRLGRPDGGRARVDLCVRLPGGRRAHGARREPFGAALRARGAARPGSAVPARLRQPAHDPRRAPHRPDRTEVIVCDPFVADERQPFLGSSFQGRRDRSPGSFGRPRTRSPMMLRWI